MRKNYILASTFAAVLAAATPSVAQAEDFGKTIADAFTEGFVAFRDGVLDSYETATKGAVELWNQATGQVAAVPPPQPGATYLTRELQVELGTAGYYPGPVDGIYGPNMADGIRRYQADNRLPVDGQVSVALLDHLRAKRGYPKS